jgi:hypothetical protein
LRFDWAIFPPAFRDANVQLEAVGECKSNEALARFLRAVVLPSVYAGAALASF